MDWKSNWYMDFMILMHDFQLEKFYDSVTVAL